MANILRFFNSHGLKAGDILFSQQSPPMWIGFIWKTNDGGAFIKWIEMRQGKFFPIEFEAWDYIEQLISAGYQIQRANPNCNRESDVP